MFDLNTMINAGLEKVQEKQILAVNAVSERFGLKLSETEVKAVLEARQLVLKDYDRVEIDASLIEKLIRAFSPSPYIEQADYQKILCELIEIFHYTKNQIDDYLTDDEIVEALAEQFNQLSRGCMELLTGRELDAFIQDIWDEMLNNEILYGGGGQW